MAAALEHEIRHGALTDGTMVEAEIDMAARLGLSRPTVRRAIGELVERGLVVRARGTGTQVRLTRSREIPATTGRTGLLALLMPDGSNPFFGEIAQVIQRQARGRGYLTIVADSDEHRQSERSVLQELQGRVDGVVVASPRLDDEALVSLLGRLNCVTINRTLPGIPAVTVDVAVGMRQAVAHLAALGHRGLAYVGGSPHSRSDRLIEACLRDECAAQDLSFQLVGHVTPDHRGGYSAGDLVLSSGATAVIAHNDLVAIGVVSRLIERGIPVPDAISVVGTDDIPFSAILNPALTSVAIDRRQVARSALDLLLDRLDHRQMEASAISVPSQLVVRSSTGPASRS